MFRSIVKIGKRITGVRCIASILHAGSNGKVLRRLTTIVSSTMLFCATMKTSCDSTMKYIETTSGLKYRNITVGRGVIAVKGISLLSTLQLSISQ